MKNGVYAYKNGKIGEFICSRMFFNNKITLDVKEWLRKNPYSKCVLLIENYIEVVVLNGNGGDVAITPTIPPTYDIFKNESNE